MKTRRNGIMLICGLAAFLLTNCHAAEVLDDFSEVELGTAWEEPGGVYLQRLGDDDLTLDVDLRSKPGWLSLSASGDQDVVKRMVLLRGDRPLKVGETLRTTLRMEGVPQGQVRDDSVAGGLVVAGSTGAGGRRSLLLIGPVNDTRMMCLAFDSSGNTIVRKVTPGVTAVSDTVELFIERTTERVFRTGYRVGDDARQVFVSGVRFADSRMSPGKAVGLFLQWDTRGDRAAGRVLFDQIAIEKKRMLPMTPVSAHAGHDRYAYCGDRVLFCGTFSQGVIGNYEWHFGDGGRAEGEVVSHIFERPGDYQVTLEVTGAGGAGGSDKDTTTVHVRQRVDESKSLARRWLFMFPGERCAYGSPSFYDLDEWDAWLDELVRMGYNGICFHNAHPYPDFVKVPGFEEAQTVSDEQRAMNRDTLTSILAKAEAHGINVHWHVYNIVVPEGLAQAHGISGAGVDSELTRRYTKRCVEAFFEAFPKFGGLVVCIGESPPTGPVEFCKEAVFEPLAAMEPQPYCVPREQCVYPQDLVHCVDGVESWNPLVKITEEQLTGDALGPRGLQWFRHTGRRTLYLVSWQPDPLFFGSYGMIRDLVNDGRAQHAEGFLVQHSGEADWLFREAWGYYMSHGDVSEREEREHFGDLIKKRFGDGVPGGAFLTAGDASGRILPTVRRQLYSRNWNYIARFGLPLESFLSMPTYSSFNRPGFPIRSEQEQRFTWWIPRSERFEVDYVSVREYVSENGDDGESAVTPLETARALDKMAEVVERYLPELRRAQVEKNDELWSRHVQDIKFQATIGRFYAAKLRAAVAWARWEHGELDEGAATEQIGELLTESIARHREALELYEKIHGQEAVKTAFRLPRPGAAAGWSYTEPLEGGVEGLHRLLRAEAAIVHKHLENGNRRVPDLHEVRRRFEQGQ